MGHKMIDHPVRTRTPNSLCTIYDLLSTLIMFE
uniref:Uncharacterized protein n=1 Tax=Arundo donax TaxID=35708 RepID=A0A0A9CEA5_ARUDO